MAPATLPVLVLRAPLSGALVPLDSVPDPVFGRRVAGDGVAIDPTSHTLLAPCSGRLAHVHAWGHALALRTPEGIEVLVHVGLETVALRGEGFRVLVREGTEVAAGTPLVEFDAAVVTPRVRSLLTPVVVTTPDRVERIVTRSGVVVAGRDTIAVLFLKGVDEGLLQPAETVSEPLVVRAPAGLHARPAARLAKAARAFSSAIEVRRGPNRADARSVLALLELDVAPMDAIQVAASGEDAEQAVRHLAALIEAGLDVPDDADARPAVEGVADAKVDDRPPGAGVMRGTAASPGLAVGCVFHAVRGFVLPAEHGADPRAERHALDRALDIATDQLRQLQARLEPGRAAIFAAQEALLADPQLLELATAAIALGRSAGFAWQDAIETHASRLSALANERVASRAADLRDVGGRVLRVLTRGGVVAAAPPGSSVLVAEELTPSDVAALDRSRVVGICTTRGGATSHAAVLARALSLPAVMASHPDVLSLADGTPVLLDGDAGTLRAWPSEHQTAGVAERQARDAARRATWLAHAHEPAITRDGERVEVLANIGGLAEACSVAEEGGEGVGLLRTEFLFLDRALPPSEDAQAEALSAIAAALGPGRPLVVRALDAGGDKPLPSLSLLPEGNPALGERGLRLLLNRPALLRAHLAATLRASAHGDVRVMFPMIARLDEWRAARAVLDEQARRLGVAPVPAGIMVEVPSAAVLAAAFAAEVAFLSIGTNDLAQYTLAIDRGHPTLASQADGLDPAVLRLIATTVDAARARSVPVGVCGDLAADPQAIPILVGLGLRSLSVRVPALAGVKARVRQLDAASCRALAARALEASSSSEVRALLAAANEGEAHP